MSRADELEAVARALCMIDGVDPDSIDDRLGWATEPAWCSYRERARRELATTSSDPGLCADDRTTASRQRKVWNITVSVDQQ
jgi:hypothetical protein